MDKFLSIYDIKIDKKPLAIDIFEIVTNIDFNSEKEIVFFAFDIAKMLQHNYNSYDYRDNLENNLEVHDVFKLINIYGYGLCRQACLLMGFICDIYNIPNRSYYIGSKRIEHDHFVIEVFYEDKWHCFDPDLGIYFIKFYGENREIVSIENIKNREFDEFEGDFKISDWIYLDKSLKELRDKDRFLEIYLEMFVENIDLFTIYKDDRFEYKYHFMDKSGLVKWYNYNKKELLLTTNIDIESIDNGYGILQNKRVASSDSHQFLNYIFKYSNFNKKEIVVNDFPLLILDVKLNINKSSKILIIINGREYDITIKKSQFLFETIERECKVNLFEKPIYSLYIESEMNMDGYEILLQSTHLIQKIDYYLKNRKG